MKKFLNVGSICAVVLFALLIIPAFTFAGHEPTHPGLIPCDGPDCGTCDFMKLGNNILQFFVQFAIIIAGLMFAWGGLTMVMSAGESGKVTEAKGMMTSSIIGILIVLSGWLLVDTLLKMVLKGGETGQIYGMWQEIQCSKQTGPSATTPTTGGGGPISPTPIPSGSPTLTPAQITNRLAGTETYKSQLCALAVQNGIGNQCDNLQAQMAIESAGNPNAVSLGGVSAGLMQMKISTARDLDAQLAGLSDQEIRDKLISDPQYSMELGVKYYAQMYNQFGQDSVKATAAYNGGPDANAQSLNCATGITKWQCEWDNDEHTLPNTGFQETRNYIINVTAVKTQIDG